MPGPDRDGVFLSYARSDGESLAAALRLRLTAEGIRLWRDREAMEGGRDWWLQITSALDAVEFMVVVMTPAAARSPLVGREWRYARQRGVCIYPVTAAPDLHFDALPRWMSSVHFYDLEHEWTKLLNDLRTRCVRRRVPFMAEDLPPEYVPRPAELARVRSHLLDESLAEPVAAVIAVRAGGGYGKTVLARALCHDEDIQNAFDDGILWITLGEQPGELTARVEDLIHVLSGQRPGFRGIEAAVARLVELLADRDILMVLDDVWDPGHLEPFLQGGSRCARLVTTRVRDAVPAGAACVDIGGMSQQEAAALLSYGLPAAAPDAILALAARLCEWPLLLKLTNAALADRVRAGQSVSSALSYVNRALDKRGLTVFDARDSAARHHAVAKTVELSLERLTAAERQRVLELPVFPEDADVPLVVLERLWAATGGLDDFDTEHLCDRLSRLSLMVFDPTTHSVRLHDIIRRLLLEELGDGITALHRTLLDACRPATGAWADLPSTESYLWDQLSAHLAGAGAAHELTETVLDLRYLAAKTHARGALAGEGDLRRAEDGGVDAPRVSLLRRHFVQCGHILNACESRADAESTLISRLAHIDSLAPLTTALAASARRPRIVARRPPPDLPHPALIRTLSTARTLLGCAVSPDGSYVVSAASDGSLTVWDAQSVSARLHLLGHASAVRRCAISADGAFIVSASYDRRLKVWDAQTGTVLRTLIGHTDAVADCAISPDGSFIVSASHDESVRIWDARTGALRQTLGTGWAEDRRGWVRRRIPHGHLAAVRACAVSPDGRLIASGSSDQTVKIWAADTGRELLTLSGHEARVSGCAFSPDGTLVASAGADRTIRVWDIERGELRFVLTGHTDAIDRCAFLPDGRSLVSASADRTIRRWRLDSEEHVVYRGHTDAVMECAASPRGDTLVSCSADRTLKVWDLSSTSAGERSVPHVAPVNRCAVSGDGQAIVSASADATLKVWCASTGAELQALAGHDHPVFGCAFGPGADNVVSASADKSLKVWNLRSGAVVASLSGHRAWVNACSVSPDAELIASASSDRTLRIWDARALIERLRIVAHPDTVTTCGFSPDGTLLVSASTDHTLKVWRLDLAREVWTSLAVEQRKFTEADWQRVLAPLVLEGHTREVNDCAIAPDSSFLVSASSDHTLKAWDLPAGTHARTFVGHRRAVIGCAISPDGSRLLSASEDRTVKVWDTRSAACLATLHVDGPLTSCAWFPDGERLIAGGDGGLYHLAWAAEPTPGHLPSSAVGG